MSDNLPPGYIEDDYQHLPECEDQPVENECICLEIIEAKADEEANNAYDSWRDNQL